MLYFWPMRIFLHHRPEVFLAMLTESVSDKHAAYVCHNFLPTSKRLFISWLPSPSAVILEPNKRKSVVASIVSPSICHEAMWLDVIILVFWSWVLSQLFHSPLSHSSRRFLISFHVLTFSSLQSLSHVRLFVTSWTTAHQASLSITNSWSPPKPRSIESVMTSNYLILCRLLLLLPSVFPNIRAFSNESTLHMRWPKYWSFWH